MLHKIFGDLLAVLKDTPLTRKFDARQGSAKFRFPGMCAMRLKKSPNDGDYSPKRRRRRRRRRVTRILRRGSFPAAIISRLARRPFIRSTRHGRDGGHVSRAAISSRGSLFFLIT